MQYASGMLRAPRRFAVRRAVVPGAWRPGAYLVLDTSQGMLRLTPRGADQYALWVLALNAALLGSAGSPGGAAEDGAAAAQRQKERGGGGGAPPGGKQLLGEMRWSSALLMG